MAKKTVIIMGPPGAGKGTQANNIVGSFDFEHVSTGEILRREVQLGSELGKEAKRFMESGELVPDHVVIGMIAAMLENGTSRNGFLFDGFPRTKEQASALANILKDHSYQINAVFNLQVPEEVLLKRLSGRLGSRSDDKPEVVKARLDVYRKDTLPLINYYRDLDKLEEINGDQTPDEVFTDIQKALEPLLEQKG